MFLAKKDFNILFSLDGPEKIHNNNRVMINGDGSFDKTINGIKMFIETCKNLNITPNFGFNIVTSGPNYDEQYDQINIDKAEKPDF